MRTTRPFIKSILSGSFNYGEPAVSLVDVHRRGVDGSWLTKRAASGVFKSLELRPDPKYAYIHLIALGDAERYGCNRNADAMLKQASWLDIPEPEDGKTFRIFINRGNKETHQTFEKHAKVYRDHKHDNPANACGDVVKSAHNDDMDRVELMIRVPVSSWGSDLHKLASGEDLPVSMSTRVPFDVCSICGHKSASRAEYCPHIKQHASEITKDGHQICVVNDYMHYFDISRVTVPADRTAYALLKAASGAPLLGAELAERFDIPLPPDVLAGYMSPDTRQTILRKLAAIEKEIEGSAPGEYNSAAADACGMESAGDIDDDAMSELRSCSSKPGEIMSGLADVKISLSLRDFMRLLLGSRFDRVSDSVGEAESLLPGIFGRLAESSDPLGDASDFDFEPSILPRRALEAIHSLQGEHSLDDEPVSRRIIITTLRRGPRGRGNGKQCPMKTDGVKDSAYKQASALAKRLATAYAMYKTAFCRRVGLDNETVLRRAVVQNYMRR